MKLLELAALLKPNYVADWFHKFVATLLERCAGSDPHVPNLLISTPPGSGKTELVGILFPTYIFADNSQAHVIALANSDSLATMASANALRQHRSDCRSGTGVHLEPLRYLAYRLYREKGLALWPATVAGAEPTGLDLPFPLR